MNSLKSRVNDRNISTKQIATLSRATCCFRLVTLLRRVGTCWVLFSRICNWSNCRYCDVVVVWLGQCNNVAPRHMHLFDCQYSTGRKPVAKSCATYCGQQYLDMLRQNVAVVWPELAKCWANNVDICCVETLPLFGRGLRAI